MTEPINVSDMVATPTGCESTNHTRTSCYGELWTCDGCGKQVCYADGMADSDLDLCDTCWCEKHEGDE